MRTVQWLVATGIENGWTVEEKHLYDDRTQLEFVRWKQVHETLVLSVDKNGAVRLAIVDGRRSLTGKNIAEQVWHHLRFNIADAHRDRLQFARRARIAEKKKAS